MAGGIGCVVLDFFLQVFYRDFDLFHAGDSTSTFGGAAGFFLVVGRVPAASFERKSAEAHELLHRSLAFGALLQRRIGKSLGHFKGLLALVASIFV